MNCDWCSSCDGQGEMAYAGWILARLEEEGRWSVFPWRDGLGGSPILLEALDAPDQWGDLGVGALVIKIELLAAEHAAPGQPLMDVVVQVNSSVVPARRAPLLKFRDHKWQCTVDGQAYSIELPPDIGDDDAQRLLRAPLWLWSGAGSSPTWQFEDAHGFLAARTMGRDEEDKRAALGRWPHARAAMKSDDAGWVNPYNFVPLASGPDRDRAHGHLGLADDRLSGRITLTLTAHAPLALSGAGRGLVQDPFRPLVVGDRWVLPGSHLAGVVRSFHEALTDSCLRVVDLDYVPVHRDLAKPQAPGTWRMAVVEPDARSVRLCEPVLHAGQEFSAVWVEARHLGNLPVHSGQEFHFAPGTADVAVPGQRARTELISGDVPELCAAAANVCPLPHWRTIVSQALPGRVLDPRAARQHPYHLPFAKVSADVRSVRATVITAYEAAAHDAGDVTTRRTGHPRPLGVPDSGAGVGAIGVRQQTTAELTPGHVLWVELKGSLIERITPSVLWRAAGTHPVAERALGYEPCSNLTALCPSCRLFGMVEERREVSPGQAQVSAYRGHVRFGLGTVSDVEGEGTRVTELGRPRPSAGQFYLVNGESVGTQAAKDKRPLREWGSAADVVDGKPEPRQIRGRKFYWANRTDNAPGARHRAAPNAHDTMSSFHQLSPRDATVTSTVTFDNLTSAQVGSLLVSMNPDLLRTERIRALLVDGTTSFTLREALDHELVLHVGRGKGVGLGAVGSSTAVEVWTDSRYTSAAAEAAEVDGLEYVEQFVRDALGRGCEDRWAALLALSALDWLAAKQVKYPPDDPPGHAEFVFDFWKKSSGAPGTVRNGTGSYRPTLVALPDAAAPDVRVPRPWLGGGAS
jgi:hypothetical protein